MKTVSRIENKYSVPSNIADQILSKLENFLASTIEGEYKTEKYAVTSLYFDTTDLSSYWDKKDGQYNRRKVRIRQYNRSSHLVCELKSAQGQYRFKQREWLCFCNFDELNENLRQDWPSALEAMPEFSFYLLRRRAPTTWVMYNRHSVDFNNGIRISLDRDIRVAQFSKNIEVDNLTCVNLVDACSRPLSILEAKIERPVYQVLPVLKFLEDYRISCSKYCLSVEATILNGD